MSQRATEKELGPYYEQAVRLGNVLVAVEIHGEGSGPRLEAAERILAEHGGATTALTEG